MLALATSTALAFLGIVFVSSAQAVVLTCGTTLSTPNTTVTLTANVGPCSSIIGVGIAAANITLDLNGFSIIGDGFQFPDFSATIGVYVQAGADGSRVKNGTVTLFSSGVYLEQASNITVTGMRLHNNIGPDGTGNWGEGLQTYFGTDVTSGNHVIQGNQIDHNGPFAGIVLYGPTQNSTVTGNSVTNNNVLDPSGHHGEGDPIMQDIGVWVVSLTGNPSFTTTNNTVQSNQIVNNGLDGVQIATFTNGNFVRQNAVTGNGFGQPAGNGFRDGDGIAIFGSSNLVESNNVVRNGGNGIAVELQANPNPVNGKNNTIRLNSAFLNGSAANTTAYDLYDGNLSPPCDNNSWLNNNEGTKSQACIN